MAKRPARAAADQVETDAPERDELAELRAELQQMQGRLSTAESALASERTGRANAETRVMSEAEKRLLAEETACDTAISSISSEADALESQIAALSDEPGHGKEVAALSRKLSQAETRLFNEQQRKRYIGNQREQAKTAASARTAEYQGRKLADGTPLDVFNPQVRQWFEAHPESFTDRNFVARARAAASAAITLEGIPENSQDYFDYVEEKVAGGRRQPAQRREPEDDPDDSPYSQPARARNVAADADGEDLDYRVRQPAPPAAGRGSIAAVAPPSRSVPNGAGGSGSRRAPALSNEEREVAIDLYANLPAADAFVKYAENKRLMATRHPGKFGAN